MKPSCYNRSVKFNHSKAMTSLPRPSALAFSSRMEPSGSNGHGLILLSCSTLHEEEALVEQRLKSWVGLLLTRILHVSNPPCLTLLLMQTDSQATPPITNIVSMRSKSSHPLDQLPTFDPDLYFSHLTSSSLGRVLLSTRQTPSTQDFIKDLVNTREWGDGVVMVADRQSQGKGRGGNEWSSPDGCLMFTCVRSINISGESAPYLNYVTCLGLIKGIRDVLGPENSKNIRIKWPNDIHVVSEASAPSSAGSVKLGGILINSNYSSEGFRVVTGIGLNVFNHDPTTCLDQIMEQSLEGGQMRLSLTREKLLARILSRLEECYSVFQASGFGPLEEDYISSWMHSGQKVKTLDVSFAGSSEKEDGQEDRELTIVGVSPTGFLLALDDYGRHYELSPDGNRLDMLNGLLRRRL